MLSLDFRIIVEQLRNRVSRHVPILKVFCFYQ
jgi:hypothetical protein